MGIKSQRDLFVRPWDWELSHSYHFTKENTGLPRSLLFRSNFNYILLGGNEDAFKKFPDTLESLTLSGIPLYTSIRNITTLTTFTFENYRTMNTPFLDDLLKVLQANSSLEVVQLRVDCALWNSEPSQRSLFKLEQLKMLTLCGPGYLFELLSWISLPEHVELDISAYEGEVNLNDVLPRVKHVATPPTHMFVVRKSRLIKFSGPSGSFTIHPISCSKASSVLTEDPLRLLETIECLDLAMLKSASDSPSELPAPNLSLFPALRTLIITNDKQIQTTLSGLLSSPKRFPSDKLELSRCNVTKAFKKTLKEFASGHGYKMSSRWRHIIISRDAPRECPDVVVGQSSQESPALAQSARFPLSSMTTGGSPSHLKLPNAGISHQNKQLSGPGPSFVEKTDSLQTAPSLPLKSRPNSSLSKPVVYEYTYNPDLKYLS
jgi:hypothetical protein